MWQDYAMAVAQCVFVVALVPAIVLGPKPPLATSLLTGLALAAISVSLGTLGLWWSSIVAGITSAEWFVLWYQGRKEWEKF